MPPIPTNGLIFSYENKIYAVDIDYSGGEHYKVQRLVNKLVNETFFEEQIAKCISLGKPKPNQKDIERIIEKIGFSFLKIIQKGKVVIVGLESNGKGKLQLSNSTSNMAQA